jgi:N-acetylglutamate synthase-like GNAT family acetyltransferase/uncharacterized glyoxalase superfamily protein PhnB
MANRADTAVTQRFMTAEPVLAVRDVVAATDYYRNVLGFEDVWRWGDPPSHGGANRDGVQIQFARNRALAEASEGREVWIRVRNVTALYAGHCERGAEVVAELEERPWGVSQYTVRDLDGYRLHFAGSGAPTKASGDLPADLRIEPRLPTWPELAALIRAVGWDDGANSETEPRVLKAALFGATAVIDGQAVGCAFLTGDNAGLYYVRDVIVHPDWQGRRIGTALMQAIMEHVRANLPERGMVALFTGENLHDFYAQFGFSGPKNGMYGMTREVR